MYNNSVKPTLYIGQYTIFTPENFSSLGEYLIAINLQQLVRLNYITDLVYNKQLGYKLKYKKFKVKYYNKTNVWTDKFHDIYIDFSFRITKTGQENWLEYNGFYHKGIDNIYSKTQNDVLNISNRDIAVETEALSKGIPFTVLQIPNSGLDASNYFNSFISASSLKRAIKKANHNKIYKTERLGR